MRAGERDVRVEPRGEHADEARPTGKRHRPTEEVAPVLAAVVRHWSALRLFDALPYVASAAAFLLSTVLDVTLHALDAPRGSPAFEDIPKLWGIMLFAVVATRDSFRAISRRT